jgi:hypothetical protein
MRAGAKTKQRRHELDGDSVNNAQTPDPAESLNASNEAAAEIFGDVNLAHGDDDHGAWLWPFLAIVAVALAIGAGLWLLV